MFQEREVVSQNMFSRTAANDRKFGAYYTDQDHVASCATFLQFPQDEEVCCFDCSAGNGAALLTVTQQCEKAKRFVIDINSTTAKELRESGNFEAVANADYLSGFEGTNSVHTFSWCNPPYGEDHASGERYEKLFVEKLHTHLAKGAVVVFVLPDYVMQGERFARIFLARYRIHHLYKFREPTYQQFKQAVAIVTKKDSNGFTREELDEYLEKVRNLEELPVTWEGEKLIVPASSAKKVLTFRTVKFDAERWTDLVCQDRQLDFEIGRLIAPKRFSDEKTLRRPMTQLSDSHMAMLATCGIGAGAVGSEKDRNYHLQRGVVTREKDTRISPTDDGKGIKAVEVDHAKITVKVAEQVIGADGRPELKITDLV